MNSLNLTEGKILHPPCLDITCKAQSPWPRCAVREFLGLVLGSSLRAGQEGISVDQWSFSGLLWRAETDLCHFWGGWRAGLEVWEGLSWSIPAQEGCPKITLVDLSRQHLPRLGPSGTGSVIRSRMSFAVVIWTWVGGCKSPLCVLSCSFQ